MSTNRTHLCHRFIYLQCCGTIFKRKHICNTKYPNISILNKPKHNKEFLKKHFEKEKRETYICLMDGFIFKRRIQAQSESIYLNDQNRDISR